MTKSFAELTETEAGNLMVVDALNLAFRWKHLGKTNFCNEYIDTVYSFANSYKCGAIAIAADKGQSSYRKELYPEYKQSRETLREGQTEAEKEAFKEFFTEYLETLDKMQEIWPVFQYQNVEADDIAAYIVKLNYFNKVWLISTDRDWDLLINDNVSRFSYINRKETRVDNFSEIHPCNIDEFLTWKCLNGDKGDDIPGFPGIGDKRAVDILRQYGDVFDIYNSLPIESKYKYMQGLNSDPEKLLLNYSLMSLLDHCEEAIQDEYRTDIREKLNEIRL